MLVRAEVSAAVRPLRGAETKKLGLGLAETTRGAKDASPAYYSAGMKNVPFKSSVREMGAASPFPGCRHELTRNW